MTHTQNDTINMNGL